MNSTKLRNSQRLSNMFDSKELKQAPQISAESIDIKPWNSNRLAKMTVYMTSKKTTNNIFCLSNRSSTNKIQDKQKHPQPLKQKQRLISITNHFPRKQVKPRTAPHNAGYRKSSYQGKPFMSKQIKKLGPVSTQEVLDDLFQENIQSINFYPQFRASVQQRKNIIFLKPYLKSAHNKKQFNASSYQGMQKLKTQLYKQIKQSQKLQKQSIQHPKTSQPDLNQQQNLPNTLNLNLNTNRTVIQYMTQYQGQNISLYNPMRSNDRNLLWRDTKRSFEAEGGFNGNGSIVGVSKGKKNQSISILREKLKNRYKSSKYANKIVRIRNGEGVPITIIQ